LSHINGSSVQNFSMPLPRPVKRDKPTMRNGLCSDEGAVRTVLNLGAESTDNMLQSLSDLPRSPLNRRAQATNGHEHVTSTPVKQLR
jgi:hypothetical protein